VLDQPFESFNETAFKTALATAAAVDSSAFRIASKRSGSTWVRIEARPEIVNTIIETFTKSPEGIRKFIKDNGVANIAWEIDGERGGLSFSPATQASEPEVRHTDQVSPETNGGPPISHPAWAKDQAATQTPRASTTIGKQHIPTKQGFHVFLSHNSKDKQVVCQLKTRLAAQKLAVWFDVDELQPGIPWQQLLESGIRSSRSVAVLVGKDGLGPWEDEEMQSALRLAVKDKRPVIPVLLPDAPSQPELPLFLGNRTWVDLRSGFTDEGIAKLVWGITGKRP
jgi:hypothetical protein